MSLHSDILFWFQANQVLVLLFNTACLEKKQQIHILKKSLKISKGGNQNLYIEEEQTTQWPKEKGQKDK
jgi:predicted Zn-dependent protease